MSMKTEYEMKNIFETVKAIIASIMQVIDAILTVIFGKKGPSLARSLASVTSDDVMSDYRDASKELDFDRKIASEIGVTVHRYAAASTAERALVDLSALSETQRDWLLTMSDDDLSRLATLNAYMCEKAALGKRCGVVGLPLLRRIPEQPVIVRDRQETPFALRMRAMKEVYRPSFSI